MKDIENNEKSPNVVSTDRASGKLKKTTKEHSTQEELRGQLAQYYERFLDWLSFNEDESTFLNVLRLFYKIPFSIIVAIVSPILAILITIIFFASF